MAMKSQKDKEYFTQAGSGRLSSPVEQGGRRLPYPLVRYEQGTICPGKEEEAKQ